MKTMSATTESSVQKDASRSDCLGRDRFGGAEPDDTAAPEVLREPQERTFGDFVRDHKRVLIGLLVLVAGTIFVFAVLPQITGLGDTLHRLERGDKSWLLLGVLFEAISIGSYIAVFQTVFSCGGVRIDWRASYEITMAGLVATKLFAAAGAGGVALTAWALRAAGLGGSIVARRMASFEILLYAVYMAALLIGGVGLRLGLFPGTAPTGLTVIPAAFGAGVILLALAFRLLPDDFARWLSRFHDGSPRRKRMIARVSTIPNTIHDGVETAVELVRHPRLGLLGAVGYWAFDIATLWACFHAFGGSPPIAVVVMAYFVGTLANVIPLPGGVGGVEGGMIGSFIAFGVNGGTAVVAVLSYRALSFWLPTLPGLVAYFQLRRTVGSWRAADPAASGQPA
jgi:putative heme transporter